MLDDWCDDAPAVAAAHTLRILSARAADLALGIEAIAAKIPRPLCIGRTYRARSGPARQTSSAKLIREKLPTTKSIRSGDLGEILATEYIDERTKYEAPIKRLRWKDHRNMALRGDDVIGMRIDENNGAGFSED